MAIRTRQNGDDPFSGMNQLQRKLDRAYEMAGLARQDGDKADEQRWFREAEKIKEQIRSLR